MTSLSYTRLSDSGEAGGYSEKAVLVAFLSLPFVDAISVYVICGDGCDFGLRAFGTIQSFEFFFAALNNFIQSEMLKNIKLFVLKS